MFNSFDLYWDGADQLNQINVHGGGAVFGTRYNGDGQRVTMQDTAGGSFPIQHEFTLGLGGLLYDSYNSAVYTPGVSQRVNGVDSYFHTDWLGSTRYLSDSTGNNFPNALRYDAFGNRSATGGSYDPSPFQFAGDSGYQSEFAAAAEQGTGLQYLEQRYYDPAIGRFLSPDPISFLGGLNLYGYAYNDPVMNLDPSGRRWKEWLSLAGGILGELAGVAEGGIGAVPGAAWDSGAGGFLGSRLDGQADDGGLRCGVLDFRVPIQEFGQIRAPQFVSVRPQETLPHEQQVVVLRPRLRREEESLAQPVYRAAASHALVLRHRLAEALGEVRVAARPNRVELPPDVAQKAVIPLLRR
jgi:RHS repeat-associated protein